MKVQYQEKLKSAGDEGKKIIEEHKVMANSEYSAAMSVAKHDAQRIIDDARKEIEVEKDKAIFELKKEVGNLVIMSQLAIIPASYFGALLMDQLKTELFLVIVLFFYMISIIPLFRLIKEKKVERNDAIHEIKNILTNIPKQSIWFLIFAQFRVVSKYIFPLYLFIYIKSNYEYIGIFNVAVGIASMFFVYIYSRRMDKKKKDYLLLSGVLSCIVWLLKLNIVATSLLLVIGLMEGLVERMYETSFNRNLYALGKHYNALDYAVVVEGLQNFVRIFIVFFIFFLINDLKLSLYITAFILMITGLIGFDDGKGGY
jgi:hypothetical protein